MRTRLTLIVVLAWAAAGITCAKKSADPSGTGTGTGTGGSCRIYAAAATEVSTSPALPPVTGIAVTGSFNSSARQFTATLLYPGGGLCDSVVASYSSIADFVDEARVIPGVTLATQSVTTPGPACGPGPASTTVYSYDSQRRLTKITQGSTITTFTAWDSSGRPTTGTRTGGASISFVYSDATRTVTVTTTTPTQKNVTSITSDANGIELQEVDGIGSAAPTTTTWTTTATGQVCK